MPPGYVYAGEKDDDEKRAWWEENKEKWEQQWAACKLSFSRETFKVKKGGIHQYVGVRRVSLSKRLAKLTGRIEDIFENKLFGLLAELDERAALIKEFEQKVEANQENVDEGEGPDAKLLKAAKKLERTDKILNWKQTINDRPLAQLDTLMLRLAYYYPQREQW